MHKILLGLGGFVAGTIAIVAIGQSGQPAATTHAGMGMATTSAMTGGAAMMGSAPTTATTTPTVALSIRHVLRGCHVWSEDGRLAPMMRLSIPRGGRLSIIDQDVDAHQLVELSGPRMAMPAPMGMMGTADLRFMQPGVYRFATRKVDLPGVKMPDSPTVGPDNHLKLFITVA